MKKLFIACNGQPSNRECHAVLFEMEAEQAATADDLKTLAETCVREYALTPEGRAAYERNGHSFTWGEMLQETEAFRTICERHGLSIHRISDNKGMDERVDMNEQLMEYITVVAEGIEWESDDPWLPEDAEVFLPSPESTAADVLAEEYRQKVRSIKTQRLADGVH